MRRAYGALVLLALAACDPPYRHGPRPALFPAPAPYHGPSVEGAEARDLVGCYRASSTNRTAGATGDGRSGWIRSLPIPAARAGRPPGA